MPSYRFPTLVYRDLSGRFTAALVENDSNIAAFAENPAAALDRLGDYLRAAYKRFPWLSQPDFTDPQLINVKVEVRPEYKVEEPLSRQPSSKRKTETRERSYPVQETLTLRVPCVHGKDRGGLLVAAMPTLGIRFSYYDAAALRGLAAYYVQNALRGLTPQQLSRHLPPADASLEDIVIHLPRAENDADDDEANLDTLRTIADPIGGREMRGRLSPPWQRGAQVTHLVQTLRHEKANVILLGESGSGKSAVLAEAVRKIEREGPAKPEEADQSDDAPPVKHKRRFWLSSAARLIAGMQYLGQWQQRVEQVIAELAEIDGVLCLDNLLDLLRTGGQGPADSIAAFFTPYLQRRELKLVAEATPAELDACRRLLPGFADLFQILTIPAFTRTEALAALEQVASQQEQNLRLTADRGTVETTHRLFSRFMPYQSFPGPAASFLTNVFDRVSRQKRPTVTSSDVISRFVQQTGLPELFLRDELLLDHSSVVASLQQQVIGQDSACHTAANVITTLKAGLNDPARPVGVLLFVGPTGVGKTELAKAISRFLFGHGEQKDRLIRLDMSEYSGLGAASRLLTDSSGGPSELIKRIRQQPFSVLLLDEIEKAAPDVFDVLLNVFDEGRLTDRWGRLTTFRSSVIIMTSNLGAQQSEPFGFSRQPATTYDSAAASFFRPEFFNRIDSIVTFHPLSAETIDLITEKELHDLSRREGLTRAALKLAWTPHLLRHLSQTGFDPRYGARPLQRAIESLVVTPLARFLVEHPTLRNREIRLDLSESGSVVFLT